MPRKRSLLEQVDFHFRCQPKVDSRDGRLLRYLQSDATELPLRAMLLNAAVAFWMPFAHKYFNDLPDDELQQSVDRAIYQLLMQIFYLEENFGSRRMVERNFYQLNQKLPTINPDSSTQLDMEASDDIISNQSDEVLTPALSGTGEWQDLDF